MFAQWCVKGIRGRNPEDVTRDGLTPDEAISIVRDGRGILCNWWRNVGTISPEERRQRLTAANLDLHINNYSSVVQTTPFISLAAGCVERDVFYRTNRIHMAEDTALAFATDNGSRFGFLFYCWVIVGLKPAVSIESVAEEVRELNSYRSWSTFQLEGELTAKIQVHANHIERVEWWEPVGGGQVQRRRAPPSWNPAYVNPRFDPPSQISNIRELF
jgi:hypothetical protein